MLIYIKIFAYVLNLSLISSTSTLEEMASSALIIKSMSTTARICLDDIPCIVYTPFRLDFAEIPVIQSMGIIANSIDDVHLAISNLYCIKKILKSSDVGDLVHGLELSSADQFDAFASNILSCAIKTSRKNNLYSEFLRYKYLIFGLIHLLVRFFFRSPVHSRMVSKCNFVRDEEILNAILSFRTANAPLCSNHEISIKTIFPNVILISP